MASTNTEKGNTLLEFIKTIISPRSGVLNNILQ